MALPESGSISMSQVNIELKKSENAQISLNDSDVRKLAKIPSGTISMSDLRGKKSSEYVENYVLFNGGWNNSNDNSVSKNFSFQLNIPHNIVNGTISVRFYQSGGDRRESPYPYIDIPNIANIELFRSSEYNDITQNKQLSNYNKTVLSCSGRTGVSRRRSGGNSGEYYTTITVSAIIKFTGEWEV